MTTETQIPDTDDVIKDMLTENTGRHILDSGGAYGRHWERNQDRDFEDEPVSETEIHGRDDGSFDVLVTLNIYHFLTSFLNYTEKADELNTRFHEFADEQNEHWLKLMKQWTDGRAVNTYNEETILGQVLQYVPFCLDVNDNPEPSDSPHRMEFILLQIHNGCDVRGGYTAPVVFEMDDWGADYWYTKMRDVYVLCNNGSCGWYSDDSGHHYYENDSDVHDYENVEYDPDLDIVYCKSCVQDGEIEARKAGDDPDIEELKRAFEVDFYASVAY